MIRIFDWVFKVIGVKHHLEEAYAEKRERVTLKKHILHDMEIIDSKSSALLTHVSLMIAVLIVLITNITMDSALIYTILKVEIFLYTVVTIFLLRCIDIMGPSFRKVSIKDEDLNRHYQEEMLIRRTIYQLMLRLVFVLTFVLVGAMLAKYTIQ